MYSTLVPCAGKTYITWMVATGSEQTLDRLRRMVAGRDEDQVSVMEDQWLDLNKQLKWKFYGWLLVCCSRLSNHAKRQMWYVTFVAKFKGLSRSGAVELAQLGLMSTERFSDNRLTAMLRDHQTRTRSMFVTDG